MSNKIKLTSLYEALIILGHPQLWISIEPLPGCLLYADIINVDGSILAWWDEASDSWFLNKEVDNLSPYDGNAAYPARKELSVEKCIQLITVYDL